MREKHYVKSIFYYIILISYIWNICLKGDISVYFNKKIVILKDGTQCILKSPDNQDAEDMLDYLRTTSDETYFMLRYPEEININLEEEREILDKIINSKTDIMIAAFVNGELAGNAGLSCAGNYIKIKHRAEFGISIKEKFWGNGIGSILLSEIIKVADIIGYEQIELTVFSDNFKAQNLYKKYGFEIWGRNKNGYRLKDGSYRDELIMGRMLSKL